MKKVVLINHSDVKGGASVVSFRLMMALSRAGVDARMLVVHKATDNLRVAQAAPAWRHEAAFLAECARLYTATGFNRQDIFKLSSGSFGMPLHNHPWVREADGRPVAGAEVTFGILNASAVFPAAVVHADERGMARLHCGFGTLIVSARKNGRCCEALYPAAQTALCLTLKAPEAPSERWREFRTQAPKDSAAPHARLPPEARALSAEKAAAAAQARRVRAAADLDPARAQALAARLGGEAEGRCR